MNLKTRKEKFINNLKQDKFKKELINPEYACYSEEQKRDIMKAIKFTRWDLPYIRTIFQNAKVQQNIDCLLYLFKVNDTKDEKLSYFSWCLICELVSHLDEEVDFNLAVGILEDFSHSTTVPHDIYSLGESLIHMNNRSFLTADAKREYFNCVLHSTKQNHEIGGNVRDLYDMCRNASVYFDESQFDSVSFFEIVKESYQGFLANRPDLCEIINEKNARYYRSIHLIDYSNWDDEDYETLINLFNTLNQELLIYKENIDTPQEKPLPNKI